MAKSQSNKKTTPPKEKRAKTTAHEPTNPHDALFKISFSMKAVIVAYLTEVFPKKYGEKLDLSTLERDNNSYVSKDLKETFSDLVWRCRLKTGRTVMLSFLFEHKSYKPKRPHLQLGVYQFGAYCAQDLANPNLPLVQVIPIMVYHGLEDWEFVEPFETYFGEIDPEFMRFMPSSDFILTNIQNYPDEVIRAFNVRFLEKIFLAYKHFRDKSFLASHFVELLLAGYTDEDNDNIFLFIKALEVYLSSQTGGGIPAAEFDHQYNIIKSLNPETMVASDRFLANIENKGRQEGRQEGQEAMILDIFKKKGWSAIQIADITSFSVEYIQSIIDKYEKNGVQQN